MSSGSFKDYIAYKLFPYKLYIYIYIYDLALNNPYALKQNQSNTDP